VLLNVTSTSPIVVWNVPAPIAYGVALSSAQLNATAGVPGTFAYTPAAGTVLGAGVQTLSVTFTPTDLGQYGPITRTVPLIVHRAVPAITWPTPANIVVGTALGPTQLNATANVPGTFVYTPAAGTVLPLGIGRPLSVAFTPADAADYTTATAAVPI